MADKLNIYFLGTSASTPTKHSNLTSLLINYKGINYLFDAPENVQQQILKLNQSLQKIKHIFITHFHGDHFYGILGLLSSMSLNKRETALTIYIPKGYLSFFENFLRASQVSVEFPLSIREVSSSTRLSFKDVYIYTQKLYHSILSFGYIFKVKDKLGKFNKQKALALNIPEGALFSKLKQGKSIILNGKKIIPSQVLDVSYKSFGKKIVYLTDTSVLKRFSKHLDSPDILIHECTFSDLDSKKARDMQHSFFSEVISFSKKISAKKTYLVHTSTRYKDKKQIVGDYKGSLKNIHFPNDLDFLTLSDY